MSFITETYQCNECKYYFNVSLGTFGSGMPEKCPKCKKMANFQHINAGWNAEELNKAAKGWKTCPHCGKELN